MKRLIASVCLLAFCMAMSAGDGVQLENIRFYAYPDYTRVVLDLSGSLKVVEKVLPGDDLTRLYFDLQHCQFSRDYPDSKKKEIGIESGNLKKIRLGRHTSTSLRVVFDFDRIGKYQKFYLTSPFRVVFDIFQEPEVATGDPAEVSTVPAERIGEKYSIIRQLGLGVRRIVIDPGHGGKDPGTLNRKLGLYEKDITLDIAKRLQQILKQKSQYEVILTRETDRYLSLEERTAIANSKKGDLFLSIHVNSSPRKHVSGIETYFLNITTDPWAIQVAAQENAVGQKSIGEMTAIVEKILKDSKKSESKILCGFIQKNLVKRLASQYSRVNDLGVKKAPFYVLVGARMPAALVEASFLSHSMEAKRLQTASYRYLVAAGLYYGIIEYIKSLGKG